MTSIAAVIEMSGVVITAYAINSPNSSNFQIINNLPNHILLIAIIGLSFFAISLRLLAVHFEKYFANLYRISMSKEVISGLWRGKYTNLSQRNNSELVKSLTIDADMIVSYAIDPLISLGSSIATLLIIATFLFLYDPENTIVIIFIIILYFFLMSILSKNKLMELGKKTETMLKKRQLYAQHIFSDVRSFKSKKIDDNLMNELNTTNINYTRYASFSNDITQFPRLFLETAITGSLIYIFLTSSGDNSSSILSSILVFGIAGLRLLPSVQKLFVAYANLNYSISFIIDFEALSLSKDDSDKKENLYIDCKEVKCNNCTITKHDQTNIEISDFYVKTGEVVSITGPSGSGKTTFVDTLIGLHQDYEGKIFVDNKEKEPGSFISSSYLTQKPNLPVGTIKEIIMPENKTERSLDRDLVTLNLGNLSPNTFIGENARNISGGEMQRLAIIKSSYEECSLKIFDESLNAVNESLRKTAFNFIRETSLNHMVIIITHDKDIASICDRQYQIIDDKLICVQKR
ncbi:ABC transporter ATP-binding protein/permease [Gammaproteobacteria bacterium]|nr:ABC transporter ATP-binding protein/permease [Gammaproteobacteria bacterium]